MEKSAPRVRFEICVPKEARGLEFFLGNNLMTGSPLVGDKIKHAATGRVFEITERCWLEGVDRTADLSLTVKEVTPSE